MERKINLVKEILLWIYITAAAVAAISTLCADESARNLLPLTHIQVAR